MSEPSRRAATIDLDEVSRLVASLERDLADVRRGDRGIDALRDEIDALKRLVDGATAHTPELEQGLVRVHGRLDDAIELVKEEAFVGADYLARIARMLGM